MYDIYTSLWKTMRLKSYNNADEIATMVYYNWEENWFTKSTPYSVSFYNIDRLYNK